MRTLRCRPAGRCRRRLHLLVRMHHQRRMRRRARRSLPQLRRRADRSPDPHRRVAATPPRRDGAQVRQLMTTPRVLIIAGSDSGGGAGIQADIKTVTMLGGHAMTAVTASTAQNTLGVQAVMPVPAEMVVAQIDSVVSDLGVDAVKIGMLGSAETAPAVAERLETLRGVPIVFDPVMVATSGATLADEATIAAFARLMRLATVTTPNLPELEALSSLSLWEREGARAEGVGRVRAERDAERAGRDEKKQKKNNTKTTQ